MRVLRLFISFLLLTGACFAVCPSSVTCPEDGATMYPTGQVQYVNGNEEHEYAHTVWGAYDPNKPPAKHTAWVVCSPDK